ncbi:MAG: hypothetical protein JNK15_17765, partial [Planctomycetes bacterium]|nr:hypothetical protein [Planctomycetota bacterium]
MRALALFVVSCALAAVGPAQQPATPAPEQQSTANVAAWLRATAAAGSTAFEVRWQPPGSTAAMLGQAAAPKEESARGSFGPDLLWLETQGAEPKTWLQVGRHTLVR